MRGIGVEWAEFMGGWHLRSLGGFDIETTSTDTTRARIVTAALVDVDGMRLVRDPPLKWIVSVDEDIPEDAVAVHHITTEMARASGVPVREALHGIVTALGNVWSHGPVVAYNCPYDFSVMNYELHRAGMPPLDIGPVIDPFILWKQREEFLKGKRKLTDACRYFGVTQEQAHEAGADALCALIVAHAIAERWPDLADVEPERLHRWQVIWGRKIRDEYREFKRDEAKLLMAEGKTVQVEKCVRQVGEIDSGWPLTDKYVAWAAAGFPSEEVRSGSVA